MPRKQPLTADEFKSIYSKVTRFCVDLLITTDRGYLLTLRQKNGYIGQWHMPGGTVFYREKIEDAIQRIATEELGVNVLVQRNLGYIEYFSEVAQRGYGYTITMVFLCRLPDQAPLNLDDQAEKFDFFPTPPDNTIEEQKDFITKLSQIHSHTL